MQKARRHSVLTYIAPTACKRMVSGSFHSAPSSSFHLSLTVLVRYRSLRSIQPYRMVPADSHKIPLVSCYSGYYLCKDSYDYGTITLFGPASHPVLLSSLQITQSFNPISIAQYGLGFSAFARHYLRNHFLIFSSSGYLDVSVPRVVSLSSNWSSTSWVAPFGHLRLITVICTSSQLFAAYHVLRLL